MVQSHATGPAGLIAPFVTRRDAADGTLYLSSGRALPRPDRRIGDWLVRWAERRPDRTFLAERDATGGWRRVSYAQAFVEVLDLAGWLIETDAGPERPLMILSENAVDHALLALAAMHVGVPVATISTAYSLLSKDHEKLKSMVSLIDPAVIHVSDLGRYADALRAIAPLHRAEVVASTAGASADLPHVLLSQARRADSASAVAAAHRDVSPDTVARLLFTSGSTGLPKAVINTHGMLTSNQEANAALMPMIETDPPVLVDWLPWSHTFGANFDFNMVLRNGGSLYIDEGKPAPGAVDATIRNITEIRPNVVLNVPRGYDMMLPALESDAAFRAAFFSANFIFYAAAALPRTIWDRLMDLSRQETGAVTPLVCAWGSTETSPLATYCHFQAETSGNIGVPVPGTTLKLVPNGEKLEVRVHGPNVTPGYFHNPGMTQAAFDHEGYYKIGDAVRLADPDDPAAGLFFDGRVSEDFKLNTGTWVSVGDLRIAGIDALSPLAQDIVIAGHDRDEVGFLVVPNEAACRRIAGLAADAPLARVLDAPALREALAQGLARLKGAGDGSSRHAGRARFLTRPLDPDAGEITDKAYINQRQVLKTRAADVEALYGADPAAFVRPAARP